MKATFSKTIRVQPDDLDDLEHVNNVRYVQWIQDISRDHWHSVVSPEIRNEVLWVVKTHHIEYKGAAVLGDNILLKTYISRSHGAISTRIVEMFHEQTGDLLVRSETDWCLLNARTLRPARITERISELFVGSGES